jgi:hypothetical protein
MTDNRFADMKAGGLLIRIVNSPLCLGTLAPADRVIGGASPGQVTSPRAAKAARPDTAAPPKVIFFTVPGHLLEELWLGEIPRIMQQQTEAAPSPAPAERPSLSTLAFLLHAIDPAFSAPIRVMLQVCPASVHAETRASAFLASAALLECNDGALEQPQLRAWLNLDEAAQEAQVAPCALPSLDLTAPERAVLRLQIGAGEGMLWDARELRVADASAVSATAQVRLLITSR